MLNEKNKAAVSTGTEATAQNYNTQNGTYRNPESLTSLKMQIGELLIYLQRPLSRNERESCLQDFESKLRQYYDLKTSGPRRL